MDNFEQFRQELRDALAHLHDPDYRPSPFLCAVMDHDPESGAGPVQSELIHAIHGLQPASDVPPDASARRDHGVLRQRFVLKLTQEETAECLHMSVRSVRRAQRVATHILARLLWEHSLAHRVAIDTEQKVRSGDSSGTSPITPFMDWRAQVRMDLSSLLAQAPEAVADVGDAIARAIELERGLTAQHGVDLQLGDIEPGLVAAIHPSALRQTLIMAVGQLTRCNSPGAITVHARADKEHIEIMLTTQMGKSTEAPDVRLIQEMLAAQRGHLDVNADGTHMCFRIQVPAVGKITVLVADDNPDQVHFYRRCASGTRYHIVHASFGQRTFEAIAAAQPDIIVLDIMLPEVDGWELLSDLKRHASMCHVPVIVCSIVQEEDLAAALGAVLYLPKPVHHRAFIEALARVLGQVSGEATTDPGSSEAIG
jgi:CheY-like chemotaxis protein